MSLLERLLKILLKEHSIVATIDWMGYLQQIYQRHKGMMKTLIKKGLKYSINGFLKFGLISMSAASPIFLKNIFSWRSNIYNVSVQCSYYGNIIMLWSLLLF